VKEGLIFTDIISHKEDGQYFLNVAVRS